MSKFEDFEFEDDLLFMSEQFEQLESLHSVFPSEKLSAKNLFKKFSDEIEQIDKENASDSTSEHISNNSEKSDQPTIKKFDNYRRTKIYKQVGSIAAAAIVLVIGVTVFNQSRSISLSDQATSPDAEYIQEKAAADAPQTGEAEINENAEDTGVAQGVQSSEEYNIYDSIQTCSVNDLGYSIDKSIMPSSENIQLDWEEINYYNNKMNTVIATINNKTVILGYLLSYPEPMDAGSTIYAGYEQGILGEFKPVQILSEPDINTYFVLDMGNDTFNSRIYSAGYSDEEIKQIEIMVENIKNSNADYIVNI